jgi:predicted negative regulator of RcsB-dependent stress response
VEQYRTEEEQVEALRRWWKENGLSTIAAIAIALAAGFGWQAWQAHDVQKEEQASDLYQAMLRAFGTQDSSVEVQGADLAEQIKGEFSGTTYAQFAALHLAAQAVRQNNLSEAEAQLRWVLGKASRGSDTVQIAQLRLARVLAASGDADQALEILDSADPGPYGASYAVARGDILLAAARANEARDAYTVAMTLAAGGGGQGVSLSVLQQKLDSLTPVPLRPMAELMNEEDVVIDAISTTNETTDVPEE